MYVCACVYNLKAIQTLYLRNTDIQRKRYRYAKMHGVLWVRMNFLSVSLTITAENWHSPKYETENVAVSLLPTNDLSFMVTEQFLLTRTKSYNCSYLGATNPRHTSRSEMFPRYSNRTNIYLTNTQYLLNFPFPRNN